VLSEDFSIFLKKKGKKNHVIKSLVDFIADFKKYLRKEKVSFENVSFKILSDYIDYIEPDKKINIRNRLRAISLYYQFIGDSGIAKFASQLREKRISKTRTSVGLKDFRGLDQKYIVTLAGFGIRNTEQMLKNAASPEQRKKLALKTGLPPKIIIEFVKLSDLSRLRGVKCIRARLYYDAGFDTVEKLAACDPENLRNELENFVKLTAFEGIAPLPKEIISTIKRSKKIKKIVEY